jgi:hypothetical protein
MIYENEADFDTDSKSSHTAPLHLQLEWYLLYFILGMKRQVERAIVQWCKENGIVLKGSGIQKCSYIKKSYKSRIETGDQEFIALVKSWGVDPNVPVTSQAAIIQRTFLARQKAEIEARDEERSAEYHSTFADTEPPKSPAAVIDKTADTELFDKPEQRVNAFKH